MEQGESLVVDEINHSYGRNQALSNVNLKFGVGATAILGPNGAGKTTLLRILATTLRIQSGDVKISDVSLRSDRKNYRSQLGYLPQRFGLVPQFSVREFLTYSAWLKAVPKGRREDAVDAAIEAVGLDRNSDSKIRELSGGTLRRVGIAQAIVNQPSVLILDEPTVGLDPQQRGQFRTILKQLTPTMVVVMATHLTDDASSICDRSIVMAGSKVLFAGTTKSLETIGSQCSGDGTAIELGYQNVIDSGAPKQC